ECFGLVCLEAMSAGRPVIGSKEGGMKEILEGNAGLLVNPNNYNEMANEIIGLLNNEALRQQLGANGRAKVLSEYNSDIIGQKMEAYYKRVIEKSKKK